MYNEKPLLQLIQTVLDSFSVKGYSESTIKTYSRIYPHLQKYCADNRITLYSESIGEQFIEFVQDSNDNISFERLQLFRGCINRLNCVLRDVQWQPLRKQCGKYEQSCFSVTVSNYEQYLTRSGKPYKKLRSYIRLVAWFLQNVEQLGCMQLNSLSANVILKIFELATCKRTFREVIGMFLQYAYERELTETNLRTVLPKVVRHQSVPSVYTPEEVEQLLDSIERTTEIGKRNYAIILMTARLGLRASDIANLRFENLHIESNKIVVKQIKTRFPLSLVLLEEVKYAIFDYVDNVRPSSADDHIFLNSGGYGFMRPASVSAVVQIAFEHSGIMLGNRRHGSHALRASLATALLREGNSYHIVQQVLGQTSIQSTKSYVKVDIETLRTNALPVPPPSGNFASLLMQGGFSV